MKILINTNCLTKGGGQKVAMNIIREIVEHSEIYASRFQFEFLCCRNSELHKYLVRHEQRVHSITFVTPGLRILWEIFCSRRLLNRTAPDVVYSIFGYPLFAKRYLQIIGEADSNLFFQEIDFWQDYPWHRRLFKKLIDVYRIYSMKRADGVIFENDIMRARAIKMFNMMENRVCYIRPSIFDMPIPAALPSRKFIPEHGEFKVLMLASWQKNKNYMIIPAVLEELKRRNVNVRFCFSVSEDFANDEYCDFRKDLEQRNVYDHIQFIGAVEMPQLPEVYNSVDAVILLSRLESFSNNIIEAWHYQKPLIISDCEWAHELAQDAALFVSRDEVNSIADGIQLLSTDENLYSKLITAGNKAYSAYPVIGEHVAQILQFIESTYHAKKN
ncbi:MAG: glycosyltransferase [Alphaproteobacteria bacterium]|nr:glycosyltransferase [Alphaproteobacteria bacterium]